MEIAQLDEAVNVDPGLQLQGPYPAGDAGPLTSTSMGNSPGELEVNSLETDGTGLIKQPESCPGEIDLSTATESEIIDHFRAFVEHRKDKEDVTKLDDDLADLEPWKLPVHKRMYRATNLLLGLENKKLEGAWKWSGEEFRGIRRTGPYGYGEKMQFMGLSRTLDFYKKDGTRTKWSMIECISLVRDSDGHMFLEVYIIYIYIYYSITIHFHPTLYS